MSNVNSHLQAYASRRAQASNLHSLRLPGRERPRVRRSTGAGDSAQAASSSEPAGAAEGAGLQAYSTASYDTISVRWLLPLPTAREMDKWRAARRSVATTAAGRPLGSALGDGAASAAAAAQAHELFDSDDDEDALEDDDGDDDGQDATGAGGADDSAADLSDLPSNDAPGGGGAGTRTDAAAERRRQRRRERAKRRREARPAGELRALDIKVQWTDLQRDELGTFDVGDLDDLASATATTAAGGATAAAAALPVREGGSAFTSTQYGRLIIETVQSAPDLKRARAEDGDVHALQSARLYVERKERRKDLERLFIICAGADVGGDARGKGPQDGMPWRLDRAVRNVAAKVWDEECERIGGAA